MALLEGSLTEELVLFKSPIDTTLESRYPLLGLTVALLQLRGYDTAQVILKSLQSHDISLEFLLIFSYQLRKHYHQLLSCA